MARADLAILAGVGIFALACLVVCGVYVYWSSDSHRDRKRRLKTQISGAQAIRRNDEQFSGIEATMSTQLSHHCKSSLYRVMFGNKHGESIVFLMADSREAAQKRATDALAAIHGITPDDVYLYHLASLRN